MSTLGVAADNQYVRDFVQTSPAQFVSIEARLPPPLASGRRKPADDLVRMENYSSNGILERAATCRTVTRTHAAQAPSITINQCSTPAGPMFLLHVPPMHRRKVKLSLNVVNKMESEQGLPPKGNLQMSLGADTPVVPNGIALSRDWPRLLCRNTWGDQGDGASLLAEAVGVARDHFSDIAGEKIMPSDAHDLMFPDQQREERTSPICSGVRRSGRVEMVRRGVLPAGVGRGFSVLQPGSCGNLEREHDSPQRSDTLPGLEIARIARTAAPRPAENSKLCPDESKGAESMRFFGDTRWWPADLVGFQSTEDAQDQPAVAAVKIRCWVQKVIDEDTEPSAWWA
ncbi:hypothetical protein FPV67DRAFT_1461847 [Lyophyllum atratum]|nr:hypothetical protein FPV67DRAFT_1461847 [Lyophyllum atratum]